MKAQNKEGVSGRGSGSPHAGPPEPGHPGAMAPGAAAVGKAAQELGHGQPGLQGDRVSAGEEGDRRRPCSY